VAIVERVVACSCGVAECSGSRGQEVVGSNRQASGQLSGDEASTEESGRRSSDLWTLGGRLDVKGPTHGWRCGATRIVQRVAVPVTYAEASG